MLATLPDLLERHKIRGHVPEWHFPFVNTILPAVEAVARSRFHDLRAAEREESTAEAIAGALLVFLRLISRGIDPAPFAGRLAKFAVLRVVAGRLTGSPSSSQDAMSRRAQQRRGFTIERLDCGNRTDPTKTSWREMAVQDRRTSPAEIAAFRVDFAAWLSRLAGRRRRIAEALAAGSRPMEVAVQFRLSRGRISQIRGEFQRSWDQFQREAAPASVGYLQGAGR